jgi:hypothetical protein
MAHDLAHGADHLPEFGVAVSGGGQTGPIMPANRPPSSTKSTDGVSLTPHGSLVAPTYLREQHVAGLQLAGWHRTEFGRARSLDVIDHGSDALREFPHRFKG